MRTRIFYVYQRGPRDRAFRTYGMQPLTALNDDSFRVVSDALTDLRQVSDSPVLGVPWILPTVGVPHTLVIATQGGQEFLLTLERRPTLQFMLVGQP